MAVDPLADLAGLVSQYAAEDFVAQRKRLREARMRWIDENECPTSYSVTTKNKAGEDVIHHTPFQVGKIQYPDEYNEEWKKKGQKHEDPAAEKQLLEGLDAVLSQTSEEKRVTILVTGDEQHAFFTGGKDESPHPPILEGEDYGDYYARVARQYEREAAATGTNTRGSIACDDGLRESPPVDSPGVGPSDAPGGSDRADVGAMLGSDADKVCPGDESGNPADAGSSDTVPDAPGAAPAGAA